VPPLIHARPRRHAENLERLREEQSQIGAADEALEQRGREEHQRREELRRETQRLKAVEGTLGPEQQTVARSLEQQRMLLTEREHGESSELDPANRPPPWAPNRCETEHAIPAPANDAQPISRASCRTSTS
tara:strand:+ start:323 stop:715 length:393 start_codon:yes stop_codon:yes gene_type:complete